jgi:predicted ATPase
MAGARHREGLAIGEDFLRIADELDDPGALVARRAVALELFFLGRFTEARGHLEHVLDAQPVERRQPVLDHYGEDPRVAGAMTLAWPLWFLGRPDRALQQSVKAVETARRLDHPLSLVYALTCSAILHQLRNDPVRATECGEQAVALAGEYDMALFGTWASIPLHWARSLEGDGRIDDAAAAIRARIEGASSAGAVVVQPYFLALLAEVEGRAGRVDDALATLDRALEVAAANDERFYEAELHRLRGEVVLRLEPADEEEAAASFARALEIARRQGARALELRAALSSGKLLRSQARPAEATAAVAGIYDWFDDGLETDDLLAARSFLEPTRAAS